MSIARSRKVATVVVRGGLAKVDSVLMAEAHEADGLLVIQSRKLKRMAKQEGPLIGGCGKLNSSDGELWVTPTVLHTKANAQLHWHLRLCAIGKIMIDLKSETIVPFVDLPALMKKRGRPITLQSLYRWKLKGLQGVQLEVVYKDGKPYTSTEALDRFNVAVTEAKSRRVVLQLPSVTTTKQAKAAHQRAKKKLAKERSARPKR